MPNKVPKPEPHSNGIFPVKPDRYKDANLWSEEAHQEWLKKPINPALTKPEPASIPSGPVHPGKGPLTPGNDDLDALGGGEASNVR